MWKLEYADAGASWGEVQARLNDAAAPISVVEVNSRSSGKLNYADYDSGLSVIVVGGYSLSRGLTLEGLMVSYFLRNSVMYDTLMQMGRWFGYRPGYEDLCRIWMPEEAEGWYSHISESIELLRSELRRMAAANATPEEFGLKVRAHPDTLMVTARNKMGSSEKVVVSVGLGNSFVETATLNKDEASLEGNRRAAIRLVEQLSALGHNVKQECDVPGLIIRGVSPDPILQFISTFKNHPISMSTDPDLVKPYIQGRMDELKSWDVLFTSVSQSNPKSLVDTSLGFEIVCQRRKEGSRRIPGALRITNKQRVASRGVEKTGLTEEQVSRAQQQYLNEHSPLAARGGRISFPDYIYRQQRTRPLLIIHLLAIGQKDDDLSDAQAVVAWSISFPETKTPERRVEYVVNTSWMQENYRYESDEFDEEELDDDI